MAERIPEDYEIARKYIRCVLKWFKAEIDRCEDCQKFFIRGRKDPKAEQVIFVVFGHSKRFTAKELIELKNCLPVEDKKPLAIAFVDSLGAVTIIASNSGILDDFGVRSWKPERRVFEHPVTNPEPGPSRSIKRGRKQVLTTKEELELKNIIVIDD